MLYVEDHNNRYNREKAAELAKLGFKVYLAENAGHGLFTNEDESRVVCFGSLLGVMRYSATHKGGMYHGSGWVLGGEGGSVLTREHYQRMLDVSSPYNCPRTTLKEHFKMYHSSSKYSEVLCNEKPDCND